MVIDHDYDVLGEDDDVSIVDSQVNDTDFKAISHKDALAALRASDKVSSDKVTRQTQTENANFLGAVCVCVVLGLRVFAKWFSQIYSTDVCLKFIN